MLKGLRRYFAFTVLSAVLVYLPGCAGIEPPSPKQIIEHPFGTSMLRAGLTKDQVLAQWGEPDLKEYDNTGKWEPSYSNVLGNLAAGGISNLYYPSNNSGVGQTITNGMVVTAEGGIGSIFQEFWPDISRKLFHRDPTHGLDAQAP